MKKSLIVFGAALILSACAQGEQANNNHSYRPFVPDRIETTGIPTCDFYFDRLEACMKKQIPSSQYQELEIGLTQAKQELLYNSPNEEIAAQRCTEALNAAKVQYADKGCTFN